MRAKGGKKNPIFRQQRFSISRPLRLNTNDSKGAPYYETHVAKASVSQHLRAFYVVYAVEEFKFH